jgi:hypothetical protein
MTPQETLAAVRKLGITIEVADGKLRLTPAIAVDLELKHAVLANKPLIIELLASPQLDARGLPLRQCGACGSPSWWQPKDSLRWICAHCQPRPEPYLGRSCVVAGGRWAKH